MSEITRVSKMRQPNTKSSSLEVNQCSIQNVQANWIHPHFSISDMLGLQQQ
jgi:hypothetical protein